MTKQKHFKRRVRERMQKTARGPLGLQYFAPAFGIVVALAMFALKSSAGTPGAYSARNLANEARSL